MNGWKVLCEKKGAVAILVGASMVVFLSIAAFAVDYGFGLVARNELKDVADAAALVGTRCLGAIYAGGTHPCAGSIAGLTPTQQQNYVLNSSDKAKIIAQVQDVGQKNTAGGKSITIANADIRIGQWNLQTQSLTVTDTKPTAVEVTARRDGTANGPISTFFARIMGITTANVTSTSVNTVSSTVMRPTAALTAVSHVEPGDITIPVGISQQWFANKSGGYCGQVIKFSPTTDPQACGGWNTLTDSPSSDKKVRDILTGLQAGTYQTPAATAGQTSFNYTNGDLSQQTFNALQNLYNAKKDAAGNWKTFVPVYGSDTCHPNGPEPIVGFATAIITSVQGAPAKTITAQVVCDAVEDNARGGGAAFGTVGAIPGLVQ